MGEKLQPVIDELDAVQKALDIAITTSSALSLNSGNWGFPGINKHDLAVRIVDLKELLSQATDPGANWDNYIASAIERLEFLKIHTVPQILHQGTGAVAPFLITIDGLQRGFLPLFNDAKSQAAKSSLAAKRTATQIRSIETRLKDLAPRSEELEQMVGRIEAASEAADQLPTDLETLAEAQEKVAALLRKAEQDKARLEQQLSDIAEIEDGLRAKSAEADAVLLRSVTAYSSATSVGLAAAFSERSKGLDRSMWGWVIGLVAALLSGSYFGSSQLRALAQSLANPDVQGVTVGVNLVLALISIGGPVWFAWLSTKQIGQRFRLSEDYAFKASISRAYEGYRREASRIDPSMEKQLLGSALSRLDEQPLRLVESSSFGSPWHELMSSDVIKDAAKSVPGFVERVAALASSALQKKNSNPQAPQVVPTLVSNGSVGVETEEKA